MEPAPVKRAADAECAFESKRADGRGHRRRGGIRQAAREAGIPEATYRWRLRAAERAAEEAEGFLPITNDEIRTLYGQADDDIKSWLAIYATWKPKRKREAWKLFINLTAIGDL